jgi:hypothetical protein
VDCSIPHQEYIEDCQVCCRPLQIAATVDDNGIPTLQVLHEDE